MAFAMAFPGDSGLPTQGGLDLERPPSRSRSTPALRSIRTPPRAHNTGGLGTPPRSAGSDKASRPPSRSRSQSGSRCGTSSGRPPTGAGTSKSVKSLPLRADVLLSNSLFEELDNGITPDFLRHHTGKDDLEEVQSLEMQLDAVSGAQRVEVLGELMPNLNQMRLNGSALHTIRDLGTSCAQLRVLWLCRSALQDLGGITAMPVLEELYISFNDVRDLSPLYTHDALQVLDVEGNLIDDFEEIANLQTVNTLRELTINSNPVCKNESFSREGILVALPQLVVLDDILREGGSSGDGLLAESIDDFDALDVGDAFAGLEEFMDPVATSGSDKETDLRPLASASDMSEQEDTEASEAVAELRLKTAAMRAETISAANSPAKSSQSPLKDEPSEQELVVDNLKRSRRPPPSVWNMQSMTGRPSPERPSTCAGFFPEKRCGTAWSHAGSSTTYRPGSSSAFTTASTAYSNDPDPNSSDLTMGDDGSVLAGNPLSAIRRRRKAAKDRGEDQGGIRDMLRRFETFTQESCFSKAELELRKRQAPEKRPGTSDVRVSAPRLLTSCGRPLAFPPSGEKVRRDTWNDIRAERGLRGESRAVSKTSIPGEKDWEEGLFEGLGSRTGKKAAKKDSLRASLRQTFDLADRDYLAPTFSTEAGEALIIE